MNNRKGVIHTRETPLRVPGKTVIPGFGEVRLRCRCGSMKFQVFVVAMPEHGEKWARARSIVCANSKCQKIIGVTPEAILDVEGERTTLEKQERMKEIAGL